MLTLSDFSFLIVTKYNDKNRLLGVYNSIRKLYPDNEVVIVYDNISAPKLNTLDKNLIEVYSSNRVYVSGGYNLALKNCTKKCFVFLHDDTFVAKNFLENIIPHISETQFCNFTTVEPPMYGNVDMLVRPIKDFGRQVDTFDIESFYKFCESHIKNITSPTTDSPFGGFFMAGFTSSINSVGGFDEYFQPYFYEDADLMLRLKAAGFTFIHVLNSLVYHMGSLTSRGTEESDLASETTSQLFIKKWKAPWEIIRKYTMENNIGHNFIKFEIITENCPPQLQRYIDLISESGSNIKVYLNGSKLNQKDIEHLQTLPYLLSTIEEPGVYEIENLKIEYVL